jgi:hypothetical protein
MKKKKLTISALGMKKPFFLENGLYGKNLLFLPEGKKKVFPPNLYLERVENAPFRH